MIPLCQMRLPGESSIKGHDTDHNALLWPWKAFNSRGISPPTQTRTQCWKRDSSIKTIRPQLAQFLVDQARQHCNRTWKCKGLRRKNYQSRWKHKFRFSSHMLRFMLETCVPTARCIISNNEWSALTAALTIALSSFSTFALGRPLPFWTWYLPFFTHSCHHLLIEESLGSYVDCSIRLTSLIKSDQTTSLKFWQVYELCKYTLAGIVIANIRYSYFSFNRSLGH